MCYDEKHHHCQPHNFFNFIKIICWGLFFGAVLGFMAVYLFDRDKRVKSSAKKVFRDMEAIGTGIKKGIKSTIKERAGAKK